MLEQGSRYPVGVDLTSGSGVVGDDAFRGLESQLCPFIALGTVGGRCSEMHEKRSDSVIGERGASVRREFGWNTELSEQQILYQGVGCTITGHLGYVHPSGVSIDLYQIIVST